MDAEQRFDFFEFVADQWGRERAAQLMGLLPGGNVEELATKADLRAATAELEARLLSKMNDQTRTILLANVAMWMSGIGAALAIAG
jgi:hypothetical protein